MQWVVWLVVVWAVLPLATGEYYTFDGQGNNLDNPDWGGANTPFVRRQVKTVGYGDGKETLAGASRPSAREITMMLGRSNGRSQPSNTRRLTDMVTYLGQFFDHEFTLRATSNDEPAEIPVPSCDPKWDRDCRGDGAIRFYRSDYVKGLPGPRQQINTVTAYLDGSVVYGSSQDRADKLRTGLKGMMASCGGMLPNAGAELHMEGLKPHDLELKAAGDIRANVHPPMLALQTLFLREHNRIASELLSQNPFWSDEHLFQEARKLNVALMQSICFNEYLPMLGISLDPYSGYDASIDVSIDNFFAAVSYRYGHSEINEILHRIDEKGKEIPDGHLLLSQSYFSPYVTLNAGIEPILRGLAIKIQAEVDVEFASAISHYLFGTPTLGAVDLIAADIQRGRDHGIPDYNTARIELGLGEVFSFEEITTDVFTQSTLRELYGTVNDIDAYIGGMAEGHVSETNLGPLFYQSLKDQYQRIRDGDRLFYKNGDNGLFTEEEIAEISATGLRDIILRNTYIDYLPENIFIVEDETDHWPERKETKEQKSDKGGAMDTGRATLALNAGYTAEYWLEEEHVHFRLKGETTGWMALGFESGGGMMDADIIICRVKDGQGEVRDTWSTTFAEPGLDEESGGTSDVTLHGFAEEGGVTEVHFSRLFDTGDDRDREINREGPTPVIYAWGNSDVIGYHGVSHRGKDTMTMTAPESSPSVGGAVSLENGDYELTWSLIGASGSRRRLLSDDGRVLFTVKFKGEGWIGLGIAGVAGGMTDADIVIAQLSKSDGDCVVHDYWSSTFTQPTADTDLGGTDDIEDISCHRQNGVTEISFSKPIVTNDPYDHPFQLDPSLSVIYAFDKTSSTLGYHMANRGSAKLQADSESPTPVPASTPDSPSPPTSGFPSCFWNGSYFLALVIDESDLVFAEATLGPMTLLWAISGDELLVKMRTAQDIWVGIGLEPEDGGMTNADMYLGHNDGQMRVSDCWSSGMALISSSLTPFYRHSGYGLPSEDTATNGEDSFIDSGASAEDGVYEYWFRRKLDTGDDRDKVIKDETIDMVYAYGSTSSLGYHGPTQRALASINFASTEGAESVVDLSATMIRTHGGIMVTAWAAVGLSGCSIARFGRGWAYWLKAHRFMQARNPVPLTPTHVFLLQISATVLALVGEVIGFSYTKGSFRTAHSITALCVVFVTFPQVSLGAAAMKKTGSVHYSKLHKGTGYFIIGLALWQIWTGLVTLGLGARIQQVFLGWAAAWFLSFHFSTMKATSREIEALFKSATLTSASPENSSNAEPQTEGPEEGADVESTPIRQRSKSRKSSILADIEKQGRGSGMMELLIKETNPEGSDAGSDASSMGATAWSESVAGGNYADDGFITSDSFLAAIQDGLLWTIINGKVYDLTTFIHEHPGGPKSIQDVVGHDGTVAFTNVHGDDEKVAQVLTGLVVGEYEDDSHLPDTDPVIHPEATLEEEKVTISQEEPPRTESKSITFEVGMSRKEWRFFAVENVNWISNDVVVIRIHIPGDERIDFPLTSHLMVRGTDPATEKQISRCFTPLIPDQDEHFNKLDLLIKCYEDGRMSGCIRRVKIGTYLEMKGPISGYPLKKGKWRRLGLIGGGSGITPLWQVITGLLENQEDETEICLVYQNRFLGDILLKEELDVLADCCPQRFRVVYVLSKPPNGWDGMSGRVNAEMLLPLMPLAEDGAFVMVCGPPGLNDSVAGNMNYDTFKREGGILSQLGYKSDMFHVF